MAVDYIQKDKECVGIVVRKRYFNAPGLVKRITFAKLALKHGAENGRRENQMP